MIKPLWAKAKDYYEKKKSSTYLYGIPRVKRPNIKETL